MNQIADIRQKMEQYRLNPSEEAKETIGISIRELPKAEYPELVALCRETVEQHPEQPEVLELLSAIYENLSEEIYEQYHAVYELVKQQKKRLASKASVTPDGKMGKRTEPDFLIREIFKTPRSIVIELLEQGRYDTEEEHEVYVNGVLWEKSKKVIVSLFELTPDTEYEINVVLGKKQSETVFIKTGTEFITLNVKEFGAKGDGVTDDTLFLQCAIHACPKNGRVYVPEGSYKVTTLFLKSNLVLELAKGAELLAETDRTKFPILPGNIESTNGEEEYSLGTWEGNPISCFAGIITGINVSNVIITGQGTIDGCASRENWWNDPKKKKIAWRPRLVFLNHCENVVLHGLKLQNSPSWNIHPYFSEHLRFIDLTVLNPSDSPNTDGLDPESCNDVEIAGVFFSLGDDCIAVKSGKIYMGRKYRKPSENIMIRQCCMQNGHGSITIGSEMAGGVKNLTVKDCKFLHTDRGLRIKTRRGRGNAAIIDGIHFEHITMDHVMTPIVINSFYFCDPDGHSDYVQSKEVFPVDERTPYIGELSFQNIEAKNCHVAAAYLYGLPEEKIRKVVFDHVRFSFAKEKKTGVPAMMDGAEEVSGLGIFARNIECLELRQVSVDGQSGEALLTEGVEHLIQE